MIQIFLILLCFSPDSRLENDPVKLQSIKCCVFSRITSWLGSNGGVILVTNVQVNLSILNSMFFDCTCGQWGGAIWFAGSSKESSISLRNVIGNKCYTTSAGCAAQFAYLLAGSTKKNVVSFLSIYQCAPDATKTRYSSIHIENGEMILESLNSTGNYVHQYPGLVIYQQNSLKMQFCTLNRNFAFSSVGMLYKSTGTNKTIAFCNIIGTFSVSSSGIMTFESAGEWTVYKCCFSDNNQYLFHVKDAQVTVSQCQISHTYAYVSGSIKENANTYTSSVTLNTLVHYISFVCDPVSTPFFSAKATPFIFVFIMGAIGHC